MKTTLLLLLLLPLTAAAGRLVGNGGEGVLQNGHLYLRDLHEYGVHFNPWLGGEVNPALAEELKGWNELGLNEREKKLLLAKLSHAEKAVPRFGFSLAHVIRFFHWQLTSEPLNLLPELFPVKHYEDSVRRQIALRYLTSILVQREEFSRLGEAGRVALILHEAAYAMARIVPVPDLNPQGIAHNVSQNLGATRAVVAMLFTAPSEGQPLVLPRLAEEGLSLSRGTYPLTFDSSLSLSSQGVKKATTLGSDPGERLRLVQEFCAALPTGTHSYTISIDAHRPSLILHWAHEYSVNGAQLILGFLDADPARQFTLEVKEGLLTRMTSPFDCNSDLNRGLTAWYNGSDYFTWWH